MPDPSEALKSSAATLRREALKLHAFNLPGDHDIPGGMRRLLDAIDRADVVTLANFDVRPSA